MPAGCLKSATAPPPGSSISTTRTAGASPCLTSETRISRTGFPSKGVGPRLKKLAASSQVLCVTHLPQIASFADHHYRVEKLESKGRTVAVIEELEGEALKNA